MTSTFAGATARTFSGVHSSRSHLLKLEALGLPALPLLVGEQARAVTPAIVEVTKKFLYESFQSGGCGNVGAVATQAVSIAVGNR